MDRYIGIDAHAKSCTMAVMGPSGKRVKEQVVETQAKVLIDFLKGLSGDKYVCLEEGQLAEWLVESLTPYAKEVVVVVPPTHHGRKSDAADAWALAEQIRVRAAGTYVFKPTRQFRGLREAVRTHTVAVRDLTRAKNRLRSMFRSRGVTKLDASIYDPEERPAWIDKLPVALRQRAQWFGERIDSAARAYEAAEAWLKNEAKKCPEVQRLETVPGIGVVRASQIVAIVVTPHRFRTTRQFWSYCGLAVVTRASSEWQRRSPNEPWQRVTQVQTRGLNWNMNRVLKTVFKGAATTVLAKSNPLREHFDRLGANGTPAHLARLTIARRIAAATLAIWKKDEVYDPTKHRSLPNAA